MVTKPARSAPVASNEPETPPPPPLASVKLHTDPIALSIRLGQPMLVAAFFIYNFSNVIADPVEGLQEILAVVAVAQVVYVLACVPEVGTKYKIGAATKKKMERRSSIQRSVFTAILSLILSGLITPFAHLVLVLFGGPFLNLVKPTFLCAAHFSLVCMFPLFYAHGVESSTWLAIGSLGQPIDEPYGALCGGLLGAWLGAVPIPLDWDREWQKWPVTIVCGIYMGAALGRLLGGTLMFGRRVVELDVPVKEE
ncbi:Glycosylphosphatidylinositol anchor biosynthesis protein 11 [Ceratocystis fimbriata CBS 114723]|uniref:Glycosylphosphatidylinositol anchor biosynthesis protein 11 n=2 Tax=Ceratocystis TaxID=5157 RepID=A0A0F8B605_CERFI|nr:Glycosylphosphatidylinositol anchor biosynthesis protein 11 [Ceratocystis platani]PHH56291.1 Glycosylphosphatidylinositol anchor biosynthesis protein 11 [Ceratocystis fimbriata CBS 114723]